MIICHDLPTYAETIRTKITKVSIYILFIYIYIYVHIYVNIYIYMYVCMYVCMYLHATSNVQGDNM